ncbi:hypothetical protein Pst134EA_031885, partial [Puccinia striiformis f. sp. tritici]|uniref:uncharacterized protein n=1 Tax=Puccinia striiformis f. sp. tritici TaxID=168172 RepID=UPI002007313F
MPAFLHHKPPVISRLAWSLLLLSTLLAGRALRLTRLESRPRSYQDQPEYSSASRPSSTSSPFIPIPIPITIAIEQYNQYNQSTQSIPQRPSSAATRLCFPTGPRAYVFSPLPAPNNPNRPILPSSSSLTTTSSASVASPTPITPGRGQLPPTDPSTTVSPASSPTASADPSNNRTPKQAPHKSDDSSSGFGSTTIKTIGIIAAVIAGLFLLWTIIRKWKFSPSKRFAKKLDDYDEDVFAPRPPSFGEKRANDYQAYSIPPPPNTGPAFSSHYPSYLPERTATPHSMMSPQKIPYANDPCGPQGYQSHRLSHVSITQPPAMFEPNPYRLSLGLGNIPHAYPPSDQHKATV